jgi:hypothetical protein
MKLSRTMLGVSSLVALFGMALRSDVQANSPFIQIWLEPVGSLTCAGPAGGQCSVSAGLKYGAVQSGYVIPDCCDTNGKDGGTCYLFSPGSESASSQPAHSTGFGGTIYPATAVTYNVSGSSGTVKSYQIYFHAFCAYWIAQSFPTGFFYLPEQTVTIDVQVRTQ